jgi:hypothetical protein
VSHLDERISISCPLAQAPARLTHFFSEHGNAAADTVKLNLRINVAVLGLPVSLTLQRTVIATIQAYRAPAEMTPRYRVQWAPESGGPFPLFAGELSIESADDYDSFSLRLSGDYKPPFGIVGKGFDVAVGNRVAEATAHDLLGRVKELVEREFQADEALKPHAAVPHLDAS